MHDPRLVLHTRAQPAALEHLHHRSIVRQDLRSQLPEPGCSGNSREMAHQCQPDTLPLVFVDNGECHLGLSRLQEDVASAAHDHRPPVIFNHGDQSHMIDEVDVQEERLSAKKRR
jgi:hypothetical protein